MNKNHNNHLNKARREVLRALERLHDAEHERDEAVRVQLADLRRRALAKKLYKTPPV